MVVNTSTSLTMSVTQQASTLTPSPSPGVMNNILEPLNYNCNAFTNNNKPQTRHNGDCKGVKNELAHRKRQSIDNSMIRFPKLDECAHFHYECSELTNFEVSLIANAKCTPKIGDTAQIESLNFFLHVHCGERNWTVRRNLQDFRFLDVQLHKCTFDRKHSRLKTLKTLTQFHGENDSTDSIVGFIDEYLHRLTQIVGPFLTCGPVLHWFEMDNKGNRLISELRDINTPAIGAAFVIKNHAKSDFETELSLEVGELVSVIEMPPVSESFYWKGKKGFEVGFFPAECVQLIDDKISRKSDDYPQLRPLNKCISPTPLNRACSPTQSADNDSFAARQDTNTIHSEGSYLHSFGGHSSSTQSRKHGLIVSLLRSFVSSRSDAGRDRNRLKQSGILKERVFGCDLCEYLANSVKELPLVLVVCSEYIEKYGLNINGIYRLSGVASTINKLRAIFDEDSVPLELQRNINDPSDDPAVDNSVPMDIHAVSSLLKLYFRELPNPLLTYSLYNSFIDTMRNAQMGDDEKVQAIRSLIISLPPPHWRTLRFLIRHLLFVSKFHESTGMTPKNLAIVWAPNLLRSRDLEQHVGFEALSLIGTQAVFTEFLIVNCDKIFDREEHEIHPSKPLYSPFIVPAKCGESNFSSKALKYIDVGPQITPGSYHTVISCRTLPPGSSVTSANGKRSKFNLRKKLHFFSARSPTARVRPSLYNITSGGDSVLENYIKNNNNSDKHRATIVSEEDDDDENDCVDDNDHLQTLQISVKRSQSFDSYIKKLRTLSRVCTQDYDDAEHRICGDEHSNKKDNDHSPTIKTDLNCNVEVENNDVVIDSTIYEIDEMQIENDSTAQLSPPTDTMIESESLPQNTVYHSLTNETSADTATQQSHSELPQVEYSTNESIDECHDNNHDNDGSHAEAIVQDEHSKTNNTQTFENVQFIDSCSPAPDTVADGQLDGCDAAAPSESDNDNNKFGNKQTAGADTAVALTEREKIEKLKLERRNQIRENYVQKVKSGAIKRSPSKIPIPKSRQQSSSEPAATGQESGAHTPLTSTRQVTSPVKMRVKKTPPASSAHRNSDIFTSFRSSPSPVDEKRKSVPSFGEGYVSPYAYRHRQGSFKRPNALQKDGSAGLEASKKAQVLVTPLRTAINKRQKMVEIDNISKIFENK